MENGFFLLGPRRKVRRRWRRDLIRFLDALNLYLYCGFDLSYAWRQAFENLADEMSPAMGHFLSPPEGETPTHYLERLVLEYPESHHRVWFGALRELYLQGAPLASAIESFSRQLLNEESREVTQHLRELPTKLNISLILFFLPPTLALLFIPLVLEFLRAF